jgi:hypothetical protein
LVGAAFAATGFATIGFATTGFAATGFAAAGLAVCAVFVTGSAAPLPRTAAGFAGAATFLATVA